MIEIFAVSYNGQPAPAELRGVFGLAGGTLGRSVDNRLPLPDRHVSRVHGRIRWDGNRFWIANVSDGNPLFLNDEEIESRKERPITPGDELRVGLYVLSVREPLGPAIDYTPLPKTAIGSPAALPSSVAGLGSGTLDSILQGGAADNPFADLLGAPGASSAPLAPASTSSPRLAPPNPTTVTPPMAPQGAPPLPAFGQPPLPVSPGVIDPLLPFDSFPAGDPLADWLRPSPPTATPSAVPSPGPNAHAFLGGIIPSDFDPFATPAVPNRLNSDDPLRDLASSGIDLGSVAAEPAKSFLEFDPARRADPRDALAGGTPSLVDPLEVVDPLKLFGGVEDRLLAPDNAFPVGAMPMKDSVPEIGAYFRQPRSMQDPSLPLPLPASTPPPTAGSLAWDASAELPADPLVVPKYEPPKAVSPERSSFLKSADLPASPLAALRPLPVSPALPATARETPASAASPERLPAADIAARPDSDLAAEQLVAAFLEGAHISRAHVAGKLTPERMRDLGVLVYQAVGGAMALIAARQITKREIGAEMTMIIPTDNNPLKFLPTPEAAMMQILGPSMPGFMTPTQAMAEAFSDLQAHELGVIAGTRAAFAELLHRFDPRVLEELSGKGGGIVDRLTPGARRGKLWNVFEARYKEICREAENDFDSLYAEAFTNAYEAEVARHRARRKTT